MLLNLADPIHCTYILLKIYDRWLVHGSYINQNLKINCLCMRISQVGFQSEILSKLLMWMKSSNKIMIFIENIYWNFFSIGIA